MWDFTNSICELLFRILSNVFYISSVHLYDCLVPTLILSVCIVNITFIQRRRQRNFQVFICHKRMPTALKLKEILGSAVKPAGTGTVCSVTLSHPWVPAVAMISPLQGEIWGLEAYWTVPFFNFIVIERQIPFPDSHVPSVSVYFSLIFTLRVTHEGLSILVFFQNKQN